MRIFVIHQCFLTERYHRECFTVSGGRLDTEVLPCYLNTEDLSQDLAQLILKDATVFTILHRSDQFPCKSAIFSDPSGKPFGKACFLERFDELSGDILRDPYTHHQILSPLCE
jgi:hypothetical protein